MISNTLRREVDITLARWEKEAAMHFCQLAREGATFVNVVYPTGLEMVQAHLNGDRAEVTLPTAKQLRANGYKLIL